VYGELASAWRSPGVDGRIARILAGDCTPARPSAEKRLYVDTVWRMHRRSLDGTQCMEF
jgi:hypothetical protein